MDKKILKEIDNAIKYIWKYEIKKDYETNKLLREDTLKNSLLHREFKSQLSQILYGNYLGRISRFKKMA